MIKRSGQPDTQTDRDLRDCVVAVPPRSFVMVAGAGSGKTTSLVKLLTVIMSEYATALKLRRQRVACITYTDIAAREIWADVGNNPLIHVSTIHSFLWMIIRSFQADIREWVKHRIGDKLTELQATAAAFGPRVQERTRERNRRERVRYVQEQDRIDAVRRFTYGTGSNYPEGILGHDDILKMVPQFLAERPVLRTLLAQQFPFIFVDECQDTTSNVVDALKAVEQQMRAQFCVGFFGDPMQRIYPTGIGTLPVEEGWARLTKPENFRCPTAVLNVANRIRHDGDGLVQTRGRQSDVNGHPQPITGSARLFILPADGNRNERVSTIQNWVAQRNNDPAWAPGPAADVKVLVIVHRMAATRLGFADLYSAMNDKAPENFKSGFLDGSAWPIRPFFSFVLPLADATRRGLEFEAMAVLRDHVPQLAKGTMRGRDMAKLLSELRVSSQRIVEEMDPGRASTNRQVLQYLRAHDLIPLDERLISYLDEQPTRAAADGTGDDVEETAREIAAMDAFLQCPPSQFWGYRDYVNEQSPFSTQQGVKGAEFERVLVVLDDDEGTHVQFSYDKLFGIAPLSARDLDNIREGKETAVERTRRLFYVCCTRALTDLTVVFFSQDPMLAERQLRAAGIFPATEILTLDDLAAQ